MFRAWGLMKYARVMPLNEFFKHWSGVRLGADLGLLPVKVATLDAMLEQAQDANLQSLAESPLTGLQLDAKRAECIRTMLTDVKE